LVVYIFASYAASGHSQIIFNPHVLRRKKVPADVIRLHNAVFYAYHGVLSDEQTLGGKFEVDVDLHCDLSRGARSDSLKQTVNYERVYDAIKQLVLGKKYFLIEALAETIAEGLLKGFKKIDKVVVRVRKPSAPVKGVIDHVEVEIARSRK
jgi:7,8-dihydroneopterin aldolase/epimerase/oxygenase